MLQIRDHEKGIDRAVYGPYLLLLQPQQLAVLTLHGEQLTLGCSSQTLPSVMHAMDAARMAFDGCRESLLTLTMHDVQV